LLNLLGVGNFWCNGVVGWGMSTAVAHLQAVPVPPISIQAPRTPGTAQALASVQAFVKDHRMRWKDMPGGFAAFEKGLHERVQAYERELVAEEMALADVDAAVCRGPVTSREI